jgi:hypothetical protein
MLSKWCLKLLLHADVFVQWLEHVTRSSRAASLLIMQIYRAPVKSQRA